MFKGIHRIKQVAALTLTACMLFGCSDPHKWEIAKMSAEQKAELGKKITADESDKLVAYMVRNTLAGKDVPAGVTIGQAIKEQEAWLEKEKVETAKAEELKKKLEAQRKAQQEAFAKALTVILVGKHNSTGEYDQRMVLFDLAFNNKTDKDIAGVKGVLHLKDMFGDKILNIGWSNDQGIQSKKTALETGSGVKINRFNDDDMKLWNTDAEKITAVYEVKTILFKDGTRMDAPE